MFKKFFEKNIFNTRDSVLVETFDTCEILYTFVGSEFWNFEKFEFKKKYGDYDYGSKELHTGEKRFPQGMSPEFCRKKIIYRTRWNIMQFRDRNNFTSLKI